MKTTNFLLYALLIFILVSLSCEKSDNNCGTIDFVPINFSEYSLITIGDNEVSDKFLVIDSEEEFKANVTLKKSGSENDLDIDFSGHTLLIGKKRITGIEGSLITQSVKNCGTNNYIYLVNIKNGGYTALGNFYFGVIIPKSKDINIEFDVSVTN